MKKSRLISIIRGANPGKLEALEDLHQEYVVYLRVCVNHMVGNHRYTVLRAQKREFFPQSEALTSQIAKNAQGQAIQIVSSWASSVYARVIRSKVTKLKDITEEDARALYTVGLNQIGKPWKFVTQGHLDTYHELMDLHGGRPPEVRDSVPMRLSEMTARLEDPEDTVIAGFWLRMSSLTPRKSIWLPLAGNPYIQNALQVSKGIQARKTKTGRWRFETVEKQDYEIPILTEDAGYLGIDVGLNVLAATSDGDLYGENVKPVFDKLYSRVRQVRANRQRQGLKDNSRRLDRLESKLSGLIKTEAGRITNTLVNRYPDTVFVIEDLDLRGCRGQKRFAYRALQKSLETKAITVKVNPAYTSQECPSCGHVSRKNRSSTRFCCRSCGSKAHADWVGARNVLKRFEDKDITCRDNPSSVKRVLRARYLTRRKSTKDSASGFGIRDPDPHALSPYNQSLTTRVSVLTGSGTGSNSIPYFT